jgi:hypothetical protein
VVGGTYEGEEQRHDIIWPHTPAPDDPIPHHTPRNARARKEEQGADDGGGGEVEGEVPSRCLDTSIDISLVDL